MKITQFNINIMKSEVAMLERNGPEFFAALSEWINDVQGLLDNLTELKILAMQIEGDHPDVIGAIDAWLAKQGEREKSGSVDVSGFRQRLESVLTEYRFKLAKVYDFMGDRGLVNFEPTGFADEFGVGDLSNQF